MTAGWLIFGCAEDVSQVAVDEAPPRPTEPTALSGAEASGERLPVASFVGRIVDGELTIEMQPPSRVQSAGLRATEQAAWCQPWVMSDGIAGVGPRNSLEVVTTGVRDAPPLADGGCGLTPGDPTMLALGTSCGEVTVRSFYRVPVNDIVVAISDVAPGGRVVMAWPLDGTEPIEGSGLPAQHMGVWTYGDLPADSGEAPYATRTWRFRHSDRGPFAFRGDVYANVVIEETCNGRDDDCDGEVDEEGVCD